MKKLIVGFCFFLSLVFLGCSKQTKEIKPEILAVGIDAVKINNVSDDISYADYTITINGVYIARLQNKPKIVKGDGIEIPLNLFRLPDETKVNSITFSMPGYSDYTANVEIQLPPKNPWQIEEREATDKFGDKTGKTIKSIRYRCKGTYRNSYNLDGEMTIFITTEVLDTIVVTAVENGNAVRLTGLFSYKIGDEIIERKSFLNLLKQGGTIRVQIYENRTTYNFVVEADGFKEAYAEAFEGKQSSITYSYKVPDKNNRIIEVIFTITYVWSYDKEEMYKNNLQLEEFIKKFFRTKDKNYIHDSRGYYRREIIQSEWSEPMIKQIRTLFNDESIEYRTYDGFFVS